MKPATFKAILFPRPYSKDHYPVYIRIYQNKKSSYLSVGILIPAGAWNPENSEVWESKATITWDLMQSMTKEELKEMRDNLARIIILPDAKQINEKIRRKIKELGNLQSRLIAEGEDITAGLLKSRAERKESIRKDGNDLLLFLEESATAKYNQRMIRTSVKYTLLMAKLKEFLRGNPFPPGVLTSGFLNDFQAFLRKKGYHQNYVNSILKTFKTFIQKEIIGEAGVLPAGKDPFARFKLPRLLPASKIQLDRKEIRKIEDLSLDEGTLLYHIRNLFVFSFYNGGIGIGDLFKLQWHNITDYGRLNYFVGGPDRERSIKLLPQSMNILSLYKSHEEKNSVYIFPFLKNDAPYSILSNPETLEKASPELLSKLSRDIAVQVTIFNRGLKKVALMAGIEKKITSQTARHSFAGIASEKISVYEIHKIFGHSGFRVTEVYLKNPGQDTLDNAMESVFG